MLALYQLVQRNWKTFRPVEAPKKQNAIRVGLIGASNIAPIAVINPAKSHPEVIVAAVAARDEAKARKYAQSHGIPIVHASYQALLDDPAIDAVYIALPNALHYEWSMKALQAKKHVLLEKPSTSNADEARSLFRNPMVGQASATGNPLVLLEAVHIRFHPAWQKFLSLIDTPDVQDAVSKLHLPKFFFPGDDIRFQYKMSGGCLMDLGYYNVQMSRQAFKAEPVECATVEARRMPAGLDQDIDQATSVTWKFLNGGTARIVSDLASVGYDCLPWLTSAIPAIKVPVCSVRHKEKIVPHPTQQGLEVSTTKAVIMWNPLGPSVWHRIDVIEDHVERHVGKKRIEKHWTERSYFKQYEGFSGDASWTTYRHQLEQFVNKIRGREGSGIWIDGEDSIKQMEMIDSAYRKAGMPVRPSSTSTI
ncbi:hypothetical protein ACLMJK_008438 [Lecanora helva]